MYVSLELKSMMDASCPSAEAAAEKQILDIDPIFVGNCKELQFMRKHVRHHHRYAATSCYTTAAH